MQGQGTAEINYRCYFVSISEVSEDDLKRYNEWQENRKRKRGTVIVESEKGILLVADKSKTFLLPGGGTKKRETREKAAVRELEEETGLKATSSKYLFSIKTSQDHKVFLVKANGNPKPKHEIKYIHWWAKNSKVKISKGTKAIIEKYLAEGH